MHRVAVFGATGATGRSALDLLSLHPDRYAVRVLTAYRDVETLAALCLYHQPELAVIADPALEKALVRRLATAGVHCEVASGPDALAKAAAASFCDTVIVAMAGLAAANVALAAARAGKRILLSDWEPTVIAGPLLEQALAGGAGELIPVDAGLFAAFQHRSADAAMHPIKQLTLVGSGGPFMGQRRAELMTVIPEQLCSPSERAGRRKAAVDSASLMARGLQLIAAHYLFHIAPEQIDVLLPPEHQIYAQAAYIDGSVRSWAAPADILETLSLAMAWPQSNLPAPVALPALESPDSTTFRCLALARQALQAGGDAPAILNAANVIAVEAFLAGSWPFLSMADLIEQVLTELPPQAVVDIQTLSERDRAAREIARRVLRNAC
jgi:1-deoxy-D-xylulose-5-phosphate reductoisomerase